MADGNGTDVSTELVDVLTELTDGAGVPGIAAGVLVDGEAYTAGVGTTSVDHPQDVDAGTLFQVGSVSKTFTSALVMQLVEEARVDLDDPVARHLPALGAATGLDTEAITIEHLLSHQAGFDGDHLFTAQRADDLGDLAAARRLFEPGTGFSYSNAGFSIAGAVIEAVTGRGFEDVARTRLLKPLGMRRGRLAADAVITHKVAMPHVTLGDETFVLRAGGWQPGWELGPLDRAAGGLIASADHLLRWCRFQLDGLADDGTALSATRAWSGCTPRSSRRRRLTRMALDWFVHEVDGATYVAHGGETPGYLTDLTVAPAGPSASRAPRTRSRGPVCSAVRRWALERFAGITEVDPPPTRPSPSTPTGSPAATSTRSAGSTSPPATRTGRSGRGDAPRRRRLAAPGAAADHHRRQRALRLRLDRRTGRRPHLPLRPRRPRLARRLDQSGFRRALRVD